MAPLYANEFQNLELIMDTNVRRVISSSPFASAAKTLCNTAIPPPPQPPPARTVPAAFQSNEAPKLTPMPNPIASAASISLALGSALSSALILTKPAPAARTQLSIRPQAARVGSKPTAPPPNLRTFIPVRGALPLEIPAPPPARCSGGAAASTTAFPDYVRLGERNPSSSSPGGVAGARKAAILWLRNDLRVHDNEALARANDEAMSVLPVYCFDPRDYGKSSSGFDKTGPYRATFLLECVANLRANLRDRGSDLVVRVGKPEQVLVELAKSVGADALYAHQEVSTEEVRTEERIMAALKEEGVETKFYWGSTLYHLEDLPFELKDMPSNYGGFREKAQSLNVRKTIEAPKRMKGLPARGNVAPGQIPSLQELGLNPQHTKGQDGRSVANASLIGGEAEALKRLKTFAMEFRGQPNKVVKDVSGDGLYGANFSCKISPWLAMGCLSPRYIFEELKKTTKRSVTSSLRKTSSGSGDGGLNWLLFELLWRDFFRFITKKYSSVKKSHDAVPATACTGALVA